MTKRYYFFNFLIGLVDVIVSVYSWIENPDDPMRQLWAGFSVISCLAYPFALYTVETIALKFTARDFWHRGFFNDDIGKNGIVAIYWVVCFFLSIPLFLLVFPFLKKKAG